MTPHEIIELAGGPGIVAERLGRAQRRITNQLQQDRLPASWYAALCQLTGRTLPHEAFTFVDMNKKGAA